jgi:hypothetical protein
MLSSCGLQSIELYYFIFPARVPLEGELCDRLGRLRVPGPATVIH